MFDLTSDHSKQIVTNYETKKRKNYFLMQQGGKIWKYKRI